MPIGWSPFQHLWTRDPLPVSQSQHKRKALVTDGRGLGEKKRPAASQSAPVLRSPRSHSAPIVAPAAVPHIEAPSLVAASHHTLRPQLSQAFRRLYGNAQHRGILAGLAILKLYCECLGTGKEDEDRGRWGYARGI